MLALPDGLVPVDEIPAVWGVILVGADGEARRTRKPLADNEEPRPLSHAIVASLARRMAAALTPAGALDAVGQQERGQAWRAFWRYAGRDLTFAEIVDLAHAAFEGSMRGAYWRDLEQRAGELGEIAEWLREATGLRGAITRDMVRGWADGLRRQQEDAERVAVAEVARRVDTEAWYARRWELLNQLLRGSEFAERATNIMANGTESPTSPPAFAGILARWVQVERALFHEFPMAARRILGEAEARTGTGRGRMQP